MASHREAKGLICFWDASSFTSLPPPCSPSNWNFRHTSRQTARNSQRWCYFFFFFCLFFGKVKVHLYCTANRVCAGSFFRGYRNLTRRQEGLGEIRGWQTRRDRRRHGSPQLVPGCCHQLGQVPLCLLLSTAGGQARQGKTSEADGAGIDMKRGVK